MTALTAAGAVYLVWLGITTLAHPSSPQVDAEQVAGRWVRRRRRAWASAG